ncbi:MAG: CBS domain-containing protein [Alphaproteobacteria bacterium]
MHVDRILKDKGAHIVAVAPTDTLADVAKVFVREKVGFAIVEAAAGKIVGTISERDITHHLAENGPQTATTPVEAAMISGFATCTKGDNLQKVMSVMTLKRTRHLVVMDDGDIQGIISIGDVVKFRLDESILDEESLRAYIAGTGYT